jgi:hypothetical protein
MPSRREKEKEKTGPFTQDKIRSNFFFLDVMAVQIGGHEVRKKAKVERLSNEAS